MKAFVKLAAAGLLVASVGATARAQEMQHKSFLGAPIFLLQPGGVTSGAVSCDGCTSESHFNARFATVIPTASPWFNLVAGVQWAPNGARVGGSRQTQPGIFYGGIIPIALIGQYTQNWLSVSIDPLGVYGPGLGGTSDAFGHDFFLEGAFVLNVGAKMMASMGAWSGLGLYFLVDQQISHAPYKAGTTDRDYWQPVLLYGLSLPVAPWK